MELRLTLGPLGFGEAGSKLVLVGGQDREIANVVERMSSSSVREPSATQTLTSAGSGKRLAYVVPLGKRPGDLDVASVREVADAVASIARLWPLRRRHARRRLSGGGSSTRRKLRPWRPPTEPPSTARSPDALIQVHTLTDGGQSPLDVARMIAAYVEPAKKTLELALYDLRLEDDTADVVRAALLGAHERGVHVRLLYNLERDSERPPIPPPPKTEPDLVESLPFETVGIPGWPDLMHHKYVVRDRDAVWTGSTNWTDDAWSREENVIVVVESAGVAIRFQDDFAQLWKKREVAASGRVPSDPIDVGGVEVGTWFSPKRGEKLAHRIAHQIGAAKRRVRVASPVITSGPILGTLAEVAADGHVDLAGIVDATQIDEVFAQWRLNGNLSWKGPSLQFLLERGHFTGKRSTPYAPGAVHDYMHAKVTVCDDTVFIGSFNLSHSGEQNAENVLEIEDAPLADRMAGFVDSIRGRYPALTLN